MKVATKAKQTEYEKIGKKIDWLDNNFRSHYFLNEASWCADRINWAWRFHKITREQMEELANRMIEIFENKRHRL